MQINQLQQLLDHLNKLKAKGGKHYKFATKSLNMDITTHNIEEIQRTLAALDDT